VLSTVLTGLGDLISRMWSGAGYYALQFLTFAASYFITTVLFAIIYKVLPGAIVSWSDVWIGASVTSLLFNIGRLVISIVFTFGSTGSAYGAAGSLIVLLIWVNFSAQIFLYGAEFTKAYANRFGSRIVTVQRRIAAQQSVAQKAQ
jgi:membrane protein